MVLPRGDCEDIRQACWRVCLPEGIASPRDHVTSGLRVLARSPKQEGAGEQGNWRGTVLKKRVQHLDEMNTSLGAGTCRTLPVYVFWSLAHFSFFPPSEIAEIVFHWPRGVSRERDHTSFDTVEARSIGIAAGFLALERSDEYMRWRIPLGGTANSKKLPPALN